MHAWVRTAERATGVLDHDAPAGFLIVAITIALVVRSWPMLGSNSLSETDSWVDLEAAGWPVRLLAVYCGTAWVTLVGIVLSVMPCLLVALYLSEYAHSRPRTIAKPVLDLLAAIPPVVYGVWGLLAIVPFVQDSLAPLLKALAAASPIFAVNQPTGFRYPDRRDRAGRDDRAA